MRCRFSCLFSSRQSICNLDFRLRPAPALASSSRSLFSPAMEEGPSATQQAFETFSPLLHGLIAFWGLLDCFLGFRILKATVRVLLAAAGAVAGFSIVMNWRPDSLVLMLGGAIFGLIIGAFLAWQLYQIAVFFMGFFFGALLTSPFSSLLDPAYDWVIPAAGGLVGGLLAVSLIKPALMAATALTGAFRLVYGVAFFFGGPSLMFFMRDLDTALLQLDNTRILFGITLFIAAIGFYSQWRADRKVAEKDE